MTLRTTTFTAVRWTAFATFARSGLQLVQIAMLTRALSPDEFGLMALVTAIVGVTSIFADMGISSAIIHHQQVTTNQRSSLYCLNLCAALVLAALLAAAGPLVARYYGDERLVSLLAFAAVTLFINALSQQVRIEAEKNLRFGGLAKIELVALLVGFTTAISLAFNGFGVYSLVIAGVAAATISSLLSWAFLAHGWQPTLRLRIEEIREFVRFGFYMSGSTIANHLNLVADLLIGGRQLGVDALGLYSLPRNLCLQVLFLVNPIVTRVSYPVMSKAQGDRMGLKSIYLKTLRMTSSMNFPIYVGLGAFAPEIAGILFGERWAGSTDILRILAAWGLLRSAGNPVGGLLLAVGRPDVAFRWNILSLLIMPPVLWLGCSYGALGLAASLLVLQLTVFVPLWYFLVRPHCGVELVEYIKPMAVPLWICLTSVALAFAAVDGLDGAILTLSVGVGIASALYIGLSHVFNREWTASMVELMVGRRVQQR